MATLKHTRSAGKIYKAAFEFNIANADTMLNTSSVLTAFGAAAGTVYDVIPIPTGSRVTGGELIVKVASDDTGTSTITVGDSASAARYLGATSLKAAARTALVPTIFVSGGEPIRITVANQNGNAANGQVRVNVDFAPEKGADYAIGTSGVTT